MALVLIVLLGFAAIAIDLAHKWSLQRQDQSASDTGVLAGALFTVNKDGPTAIADATTEVVRITYSTAQPNLTFAEWQTAYVNCVDPNKPAEYTRTGTSQCVSFTNNLEKIRVRLPNVDFDTTFGPVLGVDTISTSAAAEARIRLVAAGNILPFGLPGSAAAGEVCLKTGANPKNIVPCDGPDNGNLAFLDITQMGNFDMQTSTTCTGNTTGRLAENIAIGVDHDIGTAPMETSPFMRDRDLCPALASTPYTLQTETGNMASVLDDGFANGVNGRLGRLVDTPFANTDVAGHEIDHKPLWEFITDNAEVPRIEGWFLGHEGGVCSAASMSSKADMLLCLAAWDQTDADQLDNAYGPPGDGAPTLLSLTLDDSPRFGWVPLFFAPTLGNGNTDLNVEDYVPVFIQTTYWKCNASDCDIIHDPGELPLGGTNPSGSNKKVEASTALRIPKYALPETIRQAQPGSADALEFVLIK